MHLHNHLKCFICHYESNSTACVTTVGIWWLDNCMMSLTCTFFIVDVPSSFSPFVEFKEKTQQWKLLGEYLVLFYDFYYSKGWLFSPGLYFSACCSPERKTSRAVNSLVRPFLLAERRCGLHFRFSQDISISSKQRISEQRHWALFLYVADLTMFMSPFKSVWTPSYIPFCTFWLFRVIISYYNCKWIELLCGAKWYYSHF